MCGLRIIHSCKGGVIRTHYCFTQLDKPIVHNVCHRLQVSVMDIECLGIQVSPHGLINLAAGTYL